MEEHQEKKNIVGQSLTSEVKLFRMDMLKAIYSAGISINQFGKMKSVIERYTQLSLGNVRHLPSTFGDLVFDDVIDQIKNALKNSNRYYGIVCDGTPSFAKAEAVSLRIVTNKLDIIDIIVHIKLYDKALNAEGIAFNIIECLVNRCELNPEDWIACMCDRAATNIKAVKIVCEMLLANPARRPCNSHSICKVGEKFVIPDAELFRQ